jgi:hypothetical protein
VLTPLQEQVASIIEWLTVPGIGPERARALEETFTLSRNSTITHES